MKLGLKLWSINTDYYFEEAKRLYANNFFDYIELYVVPNTLESIEKWSTINIPFALHAPHFKHKINLADKEKEAYNFEIFNQVKIFQKELNSIFTVIHSGIEGDISETIRQLKPIIADNPSQYLIENKPYVTPIGEQQLCRGATFEEIVKVMQGTNCGFCLDVGHAICSANSLNIEPYSYVEKFNTLKPTCYHLSDNISTSYLDAHMHFKEGDYNLQTIFNIIDTSKEIAIETKKDSLTNLEDFEEDINTIQSILKTKE